MAKKARLGKATPARTGPIRNPVLKGPAGVFREMMGDSLNVARQAAYTSSSAVQGVVENTVTTAYTVIDKYMTRGHAAASLQNRSNGDRSMSNSSRYDQGRRDPWGQGGPWMEPWLQMMRMWTDTMSAFAGPAAQDFASQVNPWASMWGMGAAATVSVQVKSKRAAEVTVDLQPGSELQRLTLNSLEHVDNGDAPDIEGVEIEASPGHVTVRVTVKDKQPAGEYVGLVEDAHGHVHGEVRVTIAGK